MRILWKLWKLVLPAVLLSLASAAAWGAGGFGLRVTVPLFGLSAHGSQGLHVVLPRMLYEVTPAQPDRAAPWMYEPVAQMQPTYRALPGISIYYGVSQTEYLGRDPRLYQLLPQPGTGNQTMGLSFSYPF